MIVIRTAALLTALLAAFAATSAQLSDADKAFLARMVREGKASAIEIALNAKPVRRAPAAAPGPAATVTAANATPALDKYLFILKKQEPGAPKQYSPCAGLIALLRQDWKDVGFVSCPDTTEKAAGAQVSYLSDRVARNSLLNIHGIAGLFYSSVVGNDKTRWDPYDIGVGGYVSVNKALNSSTRSSDIDKVAYGGALELGVTTPPAIGLTNYLRVRGGGVDDDRRKIQSGAATLEYLPVQPDLRIHHPFRPGVLDAYAPFIMRIDPSLLAQYNGATGAGNVLDFNGRSDAFRLGPQLAAKFLPLPDATGPLSHLAFDVSYHWAHEFVASKSFGWFQSDLVYNLDETGHLSLTFTYKRGRDEDVGTRTDTFLASVAGKV